MQRRSPPNGGSFREEEEAVVEIGNGGPDHESPKWKQRASRKYVPIEDDAIDENAHGDNAGDHLSRGPAAHVKTRQLFGQRQDHLNTVTLRGERMTNVRSPGMATAQPRLSLRTPSTCERNPPKESSIRFFLENMQKSLLTRLASVEGTTRHLQKNVENV